jgi:cytochrome P450
MPTPRTIIGVAALAAAAAALAGRRRRATDGPPRLRAWLPGVGHGLAVMRDPAGFQRAGHAALGDVFSATVLGLDLTFVAPGPQLSRMLAASNEEFNLVAAYRKLFGRLLGEELFIEPPPESYRALGPATLKRETPGLAAFVQAWLRARLPAGEVDLLALCNGAAFHAACRYLCGEAIAEARRDELAGLFHVLESDYSVLGVLLPVETPSLRRRVAARLRAQAIFCEEVRAALADPARAHPLMRAIVEVYVPPGAAASDERVEQAALAVMGLIFGAHTNTAMGLAAVLEDLMTHPDTLAAVRAELDAHAGPLDYEALTRMPRLYRAISETLRLRANGGIWRRTLRPIELGGHTLPAGALVGSMMGLLNHDPATYPEPAAYRPERFAALTTDAFACPSTSAQRPLFGAFGAGRHVCPGRALAYVMLGVMVATIVGGYELKLRRRPRVWFDLMTAGVARPVGALTAVVAPRG